MGKYLETHIHSNSLIITPISVIPIIPLTTIMLTS